MSKMSHCFFHKIWYIFLKYFNAYISYNAHFIRLVTFFVKKNNAITQRYNAIFINQTILVLFYHYFISLFHKWLKFNISAILLLHFNVWRCYFEFSQNQCHNFIFFLSKNRLIPNKIGVSHVIPHRPHVQSSLTPVVSIILVIYIFLYITRYWCDLSSDSFVTMSALFPYFLFFIILHIYKLQHFYHQPLFYILK